MPIYTLILNFSPKHAIPLSNITVFGGACANCLLNLPKRHPSNKVSRPLVDWDLVLVMEPLTIAGALVGAVLNKILPDTVLAVLLVLLLSATANESLKKATKMYKKETKEIAKRKSGRKSESEMIRLAQAEVAQEAVSIDADGDEVVEEGVGAGTMLLSEGERGVNLQTDERSFDAELQAILEEEKTLPMNKVFALTFMFIVVLIINLLKGGGGFSPIGIKCGSLGFWLANVAVFAWILLFSYGVRKYLVKRYEVKARVNYLYVEGDIRWSSRNTLVYPFLCAFAGFFAGMFGVGGGTSSERAYRIAERITSLQRRVTAAALLPFPTIRFARSRSQGSSRDRSCWR